MKNSRLHINPIAVSLGAVEESVIDYTTDLDTVNEKEEELTLQEIVIQKDDNIFLSEPLEEVKDENIDKLIVKEEGKKRGRPKNK